MKPAHSRADEGQSSRARSPSPSFLGTTIQTYIQNALTNTIEEIKKYNAYLVDEVNYQVKVLVAAVNYNFQQLFDMHATQTLRLNSIEEIMRSHLGMTIPEDPVPSLTIPPTPIVLPGPHASTSALDASYTCVPTTTHPEVIYSDELPQEDHVLQSQSNSHSSHHSASAFGAHTKEEIKVDQELSSIAPKSDPQQVILPSSPIFHPPSPDDITSLDHTSPIDPLTAMVLYTPPPPSSEADPIPPNTPICPSSPLHSDITFPTSFTLFTGDKKGENDSSSVGGSWDI